MCISSCHWVASVKLGRSISDAKLHLQYNYRFKVSKAVATDFEVVRPGSGCGLFNVGVVCSM